MVHVALTSLILEADAVISLICVPTNPLEKKKTRQIQTHYVLEHWCACSDSTFSARCTDVGVRQVCCPDNVAATFITSVLPPSTHHSKPHSNKGLKSTSKCWTFRLITDSKRQDWFHETKAREHPSSYLDPLYKCSLFSIGCTNNYSWQFVRFFVPTQCQRCSVSSEGPRSWLQLGWRRHWLLLGCRVSATFSNSLLWDHRWNTIKQTWSIRLWHLSFRHRDTGRSVRLQVERWDLRLSYDVFTKMFTQEFWLVVITCVQYFCFKCLKCTGMIELN